MPYIVLKPVPIGGGKKIAPGTVVDAENWKNRRTLEGGRYIQRIEVGKRVDAIAKTPEPESTVVEEPVQVSEPAEKPKPVVENKIAQVKAKLAGEPKKQTAKPSKADNKKG
jgi:hypothetical protein